MQHKSHDSAYKELALGPNRPRAGNDEARGAGRGSPCTIGRVDLYASHSVLANSASWKALHLPRRLVLQAEPIFSSNSDVLFRISH